MTNLTPKPNGHPIKLVRDRTPDIVNPTTHPGLLFYGSCPERDRYRALRLKLGDEVAEYLVDDNYNELLDVLAVVEGLGALHGKTIDKMIDDIKRDKRGGFLNGVMMYGRHPEFDR
jgi:predicted house-cleaning noncanonical NTP pyrophosphatase (MazG superfamily)